MKKGILLAIFMFFFASAGANATLYTDVYDAGDVFMSVDADRGVQSVTWTFNIAQWGFDVDTQDVFEAKVIISLFDEKADGRNGSGGGNESFIFTFAPNTSADEFIFKNAAVRHEDTIYESDVLIGASLKSINNNGKMRASLEVTRGDFYFDSATLEATATAPVPEPSTVFLMGLGLAGLVGYNRKRSAKK